MANEGRRRSTLLKATKFVGACKGKVRLPVKSPFTFFFVVERNRQTHCCAALRVVFQNKARREKREEMKYKK